MRAPTSIVVVGAGATGVSAVKTLRAEGYDGPMTIIGAETTAPYRRPAVSKELLAGTKTIDQVPFGPLPSDVVVKFGVRAVGITAATLALDNGDVVPFDALLLATGSRARTLEHLRSDNVFTLRRAADVEPLRADIRRTGSLLVIGAGLIGCEVAATARDMGANVTILDVADRPSSRVMPPEVSRMVRDLHAEHDVLIHTGTTVRSVERQDDGQLLITAIDGRTWTAGTTLVAVGSVPDTELADAAGIEVNDGIVVDECFRTSIPAVFAAGDVARVPNPVLRGTYRCEQWNGAVDQGAAAARAMLGIEQGAVDVPWGWSTQYGTNIQFAGWPGDDADADVTVHGSIADRDFAAFTVADDAVIGAVGVGRPRDIRAARTMIAERSRLVH